MAQFYDQKTQVRLPIVLSEEKSQDRKTKESRHVQDTSRGKETRKSGPVLQATLNFVPWRFSHALSTVGAKQFARRAKYQWRIELSERPLVQDHECPRVPTHE